MHKGKRRVRFKGSDIPQNGSGPGDAGNCNNVVVKGKLKKNSSGKKMGTPKVESLDLQSSIHNSTQLFLLAEKLSNQENIDTNMAAGVLIGKFPTKRNLSPPSQEQRKMTPPFPNPNRVNQEKPFQRQSHQHNQQSNRREGQQKRLKDGCSIPKTNQKSRVTSGITSLPAGRKKNHHQRKGKIQQTILSKEIIKVEESLRNLEKQLQMKKRFLKPVLCNDSDSSSRGKVSSRGTITSTRTTASTVPCTPQSSETIPKSIPTKTRVQMQSPSRPQSHPLNMERRGNLLPSIFAPKKAHTTNKNSNHQKTSMSLSTPSPSSPPAANIPKRSRLFPMIAHLPETRRRIRYVQGPFRRGPVVVAPVTSNRKSK